MTSYEDNTFDESESWKRDNDSWKNGYDDPLKGLESSMPMSINTSIHLSDEALDILKNKIQQIKFN